MKKGKTKNRIKLRQQMHVKNYRNMSNNYRRTIKMMYFSVEFEIKLEKNRYNRNSENGKWSNRLVMEFTKKIV